MDFRLNTSLLCLCLTFVALIEVGVAHNVLEVEKLSEVASSKIKITKSDEMCKKQMFRLVAAYQNKELWALKVLDSWGKSQSGLFSGNLINFGHYEQCLATRHQLDDPTEGVYEGQHCMIFFKDTEDFKNVSAEVKNMVVPQNAHIELMRQYVDFYKVQMGSAMCVSSYCTPGMVREIADAMLSSNKLKTTDTYIQSSFCNTININEMRPIDMFAA